MMCRYGSFWEFPGGGRYEGWWKDGWMNGHGRFTIYGAIYEGEYVEGNKCGSGKMIFANKSEYEGGWKDGAKHGNGVDIYAHNGEKWEGEYQNGKRKEDILIPRDQAVALDWKEIKDSLKINHIILIAHQRDVRKRQKSRNPLQSSSDARILESLRKFFLTKESAIYLLCGWQAM